MEDKHFTEQKACYLLEVDELLYAGDNDMLYILNRLHEAANDPEILKGNDLEDECFKRRDGEVVAVYEIQNWRVLVPAILMHYAYFLDK